MLKTLSALLLLTLPAFGQIGNFGDPAWFGTVATPAAPSTLNNGLVAYWNFDETAANPNNVTREDAVGTVDLVATNAPVSTTGKNSNGVSLVAGSSQYLYVTDANAAAIDFGDVDFTFAVWAKFTTLEGGIFSKYNSLSDNRQFRLIHAASKIRWDCRNGTVGTISVSSAATVTTDTWYLIVCWHNATANEIGIHVLGQTEATAAMASGPENTTAAFQVGTQYNEAVFLNGIVDELMAWNRVLTANERTELYNAGNGKFGPSF